MSSSAIVSKLKNMIGFGDEYEDDYEDDMIEEVEQESRPAQRPSYLKKQKIVPMNGENNHNKIVVLKPVCFNDSMLVADELKKRRPVVINVGSLDTQEAGRVVDFIAGTVYGLDGNMQKVSGGIFLATPAQVDIMGEVADENGDNYKWSMF